MENLPEDTSIPSKQRLVFGIFDDQAALVRALGEFAIKGFSREELCLLVNEEVMSTTRAFTVDQLHADTRKFAPLFDVEPCAFSHEVESLTGTKGPVLVILNRVLSGAPELEQNLQDREATSSMIGNIKRGCLMLVAAITKPRQLSHASKILLRHSAHDVRTKEFLL